MCVLVGIQLCVITVRVTVCASEITIVKKPKRFAHYLSNTKICVVFYHPETIVVCRLVVS